METSDIDGGYQTTDGENQLSVFKSNQRISNHDDDFSFHTGDEVPELL
jgi:hypothetical protein